MSVGFAAPVVVAALLTIPLVVFSRHLRPGVAAVSLAASAGAVTAAMVWALMSLVLGAVARVPAVEHVSAWCPDLYRADDHVGPWLGVLGGVLLVVAGSRAAGAVRAHRRLQRRLPDCGGGTLILESEVAAAYAVPGRRGGVVLSRGMVDALDVDERAVVLAHERSHLAHRHHRYLVVGAVTAAAVPLLRPVAAAIHFATERWADEDAATEVGGDRRLVAQAIARAAIATAGHTTGAMAVAEAGVVGRVRALVDSDAGLRPSLVVTAAATFATMSVLGSSTIQLHHLVTFLTHICGGA